jgi:SAM-dependent methyltransferase
MLAAWKIRRALVVAGLLTVLAPPGAVLSQNKSVNPGINKSFEKPDVDEFVGRFEKEGRDAFDHRFEIVAACGLKHGMSVADVGAGTGLFTRLFAEKVGPKGRVFAVDIAESFVKHIETSAKQEKRDNVVGVLCTADSVNLPDESIDLAFICDTYHHFEFPYKTMRSIHRALRPGGQVVLVDFHKIAGKSSEFVMGHVRAGQEVFCREIRQAGFRQVEELPDLLKESYFVRFEKTPDPQISAAAMEPGGVLVHTVTSEYQSAPTQVRVLLPEKREPDRRYPVVYVLPVEAGVEDRYGNGLAEVKQHDLHNKFGLIFVAPTFAQLPWYADHPTNAGIRQESYFLNVVVPFVETQYPAISEPAGRLLLGFSKSGYGAWSLLLRHSEYFGRAVAWDAPLAKTEPNQFGMNGIYGTQENFEHYRIDTLLKQRATELKGPPRLLLFGYDNFRDHHERIHTLMNELKIPHDYRDGPKRKHDWHSGWVADSVEWLYHP